MIETVLYILTLNTILLSTNRIINNNILICSNDKVVSSVSELENNYSVDKSIILRTYSLKFNALRPCELLDFHESTFFLDSLANFLSDNREVIMEVGVHLSLRYSDNYSNRFDCKHVEIISKLLERGVLPSQLTGFSYLNKKPIIKSDKLEEETLEFQEKEIATNVRIEFKIE